MSSDERFPYSRRAIVGAGSMGLVAAAAPALRAEFEGGAPLDAKRGACPWRAARSENQISPAAISQAAAALARAR